jgi:hypothetical protein
MTRRDLLFTDQTIQHIYNFYDFHGDQTAKAIFDSIIREPYSPKLKTHPRGFSEVVPHYEAALQDLEENLGRVIWSIDDEKIIKLVKPDFRRFVYCEKEIIIYENDCCRVKAYESSNNYWMRCAAIINSSPRTLQRDHARSLAFKMTGVSKRPRLEKAVCSDIGGLLVGRVVKTTNIR